jgi:hypothetical protein
MNISNQIYRVAASVIFIICSIVEPAIGESGTKDPIDQVLTSEDYKRQLAPSAKPRDTSVINLVCSGVFSITGTDNKGKTTVMVDNTSFESGVQVNLGTKIVTFDGHSYPASTSEVRIAGDIREGNVVRKIDIDRISGNFEHTMISDNKSWELMKLHRGKCVSASKAF